MLFYIIGDDELISTNVTDYTGLESNITLFFILSFLFTIIIFVIKKYYSKIKII